MFTSFAHGEISLRLFLLIQSTQPSFRGHFGTNGDTLSYSVICRSFIHKTQVKVLIPRFPLFPFLTLVHAWFISLLVRSVYPRLRSPEDHFYRLFL